MTRAGAQRAEAVSRAARARVAVVAAMREELAPLIGRARIDHEVRLDVCRVHCGSLGGTPLLLAHTGEGRGCAERGATALLRRFPVSTLFVVGVSGGLSPALAPGSLVVARQVREAGRAAPPPDAAWIDRALRQAGVREATVLSSERILCTARAKREARASLEDDGPATVDLESAAYARTAARFEVGYVVLRAVCDAADEELPFDLNLCRDASGRVDRMRVARRALRHPASMAVLWKLRGRVASCADGLADLVEALLEGAPA